MGKEKFYYNEQTLRYEKLETPLKSRILSALGILVLSAILSVALYHFVPSPFERAQAREIQQLEMQHIAMSDQVDKMSKVLDNIHDRDANVHRVVFGMDPIDNQVWNGGQGGSEKYDFITNYKSTGELLQSAQQKADKLKRQLAIQSESLDNLEEEAKLREEKLAAIPAIKPIREDKLKRNIRALSGFGMRMHPVFKRKRMHRGMDFTCPKGTDIQATGAGVIEKVVKKKTGYGTHIIINHGYGYQSLYAHMGSVTVKVGEKVTRGQIIGTVGNTGTSTAPHLHYEVIHKGNKVNPINYCMDGLSAKEYQALVDAASKINQSFD